MKYNITLDTQLHKYVDLVFPFKKEVVEGVEHIIFQLLTKWTNLKAMLAGSRVDESCYKDYKPFTAKELCQHFGVYLLHCLSPSPQVGQKSKPQIFDPVHRKDVVYNALDVNAVCCHRHFRAFFSCRNPLIETPSRESFPNWKVCPILLWINLVFPMIWLLRVAFL